MVILKNMYKFCINYCNNKNASGFLKRAFVMYLRYYLLSWSQEGKYGIVWMLRSPPCALCITEWVMAFGRVASQGVSHGSRGVRKSTYINHLCACACRPRSVHASLSRATGISRLGQGKFTSSRHRTLNQCWFNGDPPSTTLDQR